MIDTAATPAQVLAAQTWAELGLDRTPANLRRLQRAFHPDLCSHHAAADAFARVQELYLQPEFQLRTAQGSRVGAGVIEWRTKPGFEDLAAVCRAAHRDLARCRHPSFFTVDDAAHPGPAFPAGPGAAGPGLAIRYDQGGAKWWLASAFDRIDGRTAIWVAKRLAAAISEAASVGWVHGDIHPGTVILCPAEHGLRLDGWWSAAREGERLTVRPTAPTPPRWIGGGAADQSLAVAQAAAWLRTTDSPQQLINLFEHHAAAPGQATDFFEDVTLTARRLYGKDSWHHLPEPKVPPI
ncbi:MAG: hypothetical protein LBK95_01090 [Bifidobacteriaceae bacterium]|jgi:hypothetical protein|nr:hypothetical protein [Bifidobacteriaceae bacterium]